MVAMPTVIFCVLNLMILAIFITSRFKHDKRQDQRRHFSGQDEVNPPRLVRATSSFLERVKSLNFSSYITEQPEPFHSVTQFSDDPHEEKEQKVEEEKEQKVEEMAGVDNDQAARSEPEKSGVKALRAKMMKSASEKAVVVEKEQEEGEAVEMRRPETMRESKESWSTRTAALLGEDEAVDEKADKFINQFRRQLKLERLHSIVRSNERSMNGGVAGGTTYD